MSDAKSARPPAVRLVVIDPQDLADIVRRAVREEMNAILHGEPGDSPITAEELARMRRLLRRKGIIP